MRKTWVQPVQVLRLTGGRIVRLCAAFGPVVLSRVNKARTYTGFIPGSMRNNIHLKNSPLTTVTFPVIPTIHNANKYNNKVNILNIFIGAPR